MSLGMNLLGVFILCKRAPGPLTVTCAIRSLMALDRGAAVMQHEDPSLTVPL